MGSVPFCRWCTGADIGALQQKILGSGLSASMLARDVPDADIDALQKVVLDYGDGWSAYRFAKDIPGADIKALQQVVLASGDGKDAYEFAAHVPGANLAALQQVVIERGSGIDAYKFAKEISGTDIAALQDVVLKRGRGWDAYRFARSVQGADTQSLQNVVLERGDAWDVLYFARDVRGADLVACDNRMQDIYANNRGNKDYMEPIDQFNGNQYIQERLKYQKELNTFPLITENSEQSSSSIHAASYTDKNVNSPALSATQAAIQQDLMGMDHGWDAYVSARDTPDADIEALQRVVVNSCNSDAAYCFARDIPCADIHALQRVVVASGYDSDVYRFARDIPDADLIALQNRMQELRKNGNIFGYPDAFNENVDIQDRLKAQIARQDTKTTHKLNHPK